jgi:VanZ family protein
MTIKAVAKFCSVAAIVLVVFAALGPVNWAPRTELGWQLDHFLGWFAITSLVCFAWPRPFVVGGALMVFAALLEGLQAFTPDRSANLLAAVCGAGGALAAALFAELFIEHEGGVSASGWNPTLGTLFQALDGEDAGVSNVRFSNRPVGVKHFQTSLIGRLGSSTFRLSTTAVSMSLTGSCFSSESARRPFHHGIRGRGGTIYAAALPSE